MRHIMLIANSGGHLSELMQLRDTFSMYTHCLITEKNPSTVNINKEVDGRVYFVKSVSRKSLLKFIPVFMLNIIKSLILVIKEKPDIIITTGASIAVPFCYWAKLFRKKIIFIESYANINNPTLTGRIVYPISDLFIIQWQELKRFYPKAVYIGGVY